MAGIESTAFVNQASEIAASLADGDVSRSEIEADIQTLVDDFDAVLLAEDDPAGRTVARGDSLSILIGTNDGSTLRGRLNSDVIIGGAGEDTLNGGRSADGLFGGDANDELDGNGGDDLIDGGDGDDLIIGGKGNDELRGNEGNDEILGGRGEDIIVGGSQGDDISGGSGDDELLGGNGQDRISGNVGNDRVIGGSANDRLFGRDGADSFVFDPSNNREGDDVIRDFEISIEFEEVILIEATDTIEISAFDIEAATDDIASIDGNPELTAADLDESPAWSLGASDDGDTLITHPGGTIELAGVAFDEGLTFQDLQDGGALVITGNILIG
ncbi:MAG: calcium-binding protein [Pseudomonadota bacterium]